MTRQLSNKVMSYRDTVRNLRPIPQSTYHQYHQDVMASIAARKRNRSESPCDEDTERPRGCEAQLQSQPTTPQAKRVRRSLQQASTATVSGSTEQEEPESELTTADGSSMSVDDPMTGSDRAAPAGRVPANPTLTRPTDAPSRLYPDVSTLMGVATSASGAPSRMDASRREPHPSHHSSANTSTEALPFPSNREDGQSDGSTRVGPSDGNGHLSPSAGGTSPSSIPSVPSVLPCVFSPIFLPPPIGGFPKVHRAMPQALTLNLHPVQLRDWSARPRKTSAAVQIYGIHALQQGGAKIVIDRLRSGVVSITGCKAAEVAAPIACQGLAEVAVASIASQAADLRPTQPPACTFFLFNLSEFAASRLKKQVCWSTKTVAFFAYDLDPVIPDFLFTLHGFSLHVPQDLETLVKKTIMQPNYRDFTLSLARDNPEFSDLRPDVVFDILLRSITVKVIELVPSGPLVVNIYGKSPTASPELWCIWRDALANAEYYDSFVGHGRVRPGWNMSCSGCHGSDHLRPHCPFRRVLGWNLGTAVSSK
ncbi:hypothetical protein OH77DRAFT_1225859 [Trametes cingulata]|nr:hypothetical protein OH77DRAFT_1225859 [Trametes cingulata]